MASQRRKLNCIFSVSFLSSILFLCILLLCFCRVDCYARDTLKHGEQITDDGGGTTLVSSGGRFKLGFFNATGSASPKRYVGIWYNEWDQQTVVWVANRDNPVTDGSTGVSFGIAEDGNLKVWDTTGNIYWSTKCVGNSSPTNQTVKLMDSGNLVLMDDQLAKSLWESFQNPTDTFLPGMKMDKHLELISWAGDCDPGKGNFTFKQDLGGEGRYVISKKPLDYWRSWMSGNFLRSDDEMPYDYLLSNFSNTKYPHWPNSSKQPQLDNYKRMNYTNDSYARLVMNYTGELQYLKWDVDERNWSLIWRAPEDQCDVYNACGEYGICNSNHRLICKCLPGFQPTNPKNWDSGDYLGGCARNSKSFDNNNMFLNLKMMKVGKPDSYFPEINETECRKQCLAQGKCEAYSYDVAQNSTLRITGIDNCKIWNLALSNLQEEYTNHASNLSVRVPKSIIESTVRNCEPCGSNLIPYPLSTGTNCGDPIYFSFYCNTSSGQVSFKAPSGTYRVTIIDPSARTFVIQVKYAGYDRNSRGTQLLNESLPFKRNYSSEVKDEIEISWEPPQQPSCNSSRDCKDWPNSTCNITIDGKKRCLCKQNFLWNGTILNCTTKGNNPQWFIKPSKRKKRLLLSVMVPLIISVFALTCSITFVYVWRRKKAREEESRKSSRRNRVLRALDTEKHVKDLIDSGEFREEDEKGIDVPFFDLECILAATDNFSDTKKLGKGGFGFVYKATFPGSQEIAVKRLSSVSRQGFQEFKNEVVLIAKLQHRNLVRLRGYCIDGDEKILLYEYMPNKSLDSFIFDQKLSMSLDWEMRFKIILGIARGLVYLHHDSRLRIIHRDLKTSNILLDKEMKPRISDFGLAKMVEGRQTEANTTRVVGTHGYISPEYAQHGIFSIKSDVFSFGVVLLEIISGKKNTEFYESELAPSLLGYAWRLWVENKVLDLMDHTLHEVCNADQFVKCVNIGLLCVQDNANDRPTMLNVVAMLDSEVGTISTPKRPAFVPGTDPSSTANSARHDTHTELTNSLEGR